ncbi:zinc C2H2 type domain-containing protein [Cryptosporidium felis]|nr:zinc C2H2 type domain-containing protein [Cryptosporidium felis]
MSLGGARRNSLGRKRPIRRPGEIKEKKRKRLKTGTSPLSLPDEERTKQAPERARVSSWEMQRATPLLCTVCGHQLGNGDSLREHYKTDWHIYNQKRKLANREPVSESAFARKLELLEFSGLKSEKGVSHIKQRPRPGGEGQPSGEAAKERQQDAYRPTYSYFDGTIHPTAEECFEYMRRRYSFVIPDRDYLVDFDGLAQYLGEKLFEGHICLYCDRVFSSLMGVRDHMISLGHTMLGTHLDVQKEELERFYNYSSSYKELIPNFSRMAISGEKRAEDDEEWEYVDEENECGGELLLDDVLAVYNLRSPEITEYGDLRLPNGKEVVHRDLAYIYKQRVPPRREEKQTRGPGGGGGGGGGGGDEIALKGRQRSKRLGAVARKDGAILDPGLLRGSRKAQTKQSLLLSRRIKNFNLKVGVNNNKLQKFFVRRDIVWSQLPALVDDYWYLRLAVRRQDRRVFNLLQSGEGVVAQQLPENNVLVVQPRARAAGYEELTPIRIRRPASHPRSRSHLPAPQSPLSLCGSWTPSRSRAFLSCSPPPTGRRPKTPPGCPCVAAAAAPDP